MRLKKCENQRRIVYAMTGSRIDSPYTLSGEHSSSTAKKNVFATAASRFDIP